MNSIDRTKAPQVFPITLPQIGVFEREKLSSGADLYILRGGSQPITQIIFSYDAGRRCQNSIQTLADTTLNMMFEGTTTRSTSQISTEIEYYGADLNVDSTMDSARISLSAPTRFISQALNVVVDCLLHPTFPAKELKRSKDIRTEQLKYNLMRSEYVVGDLIKNIIWPDGCDYRIPLTAKSIHAVKREQLIEFHKQFFTPEGLSIFVAGQPDEAVLDILRNIYTQPIHCERPTYAPPKRNTPDGKVHTKKLPQSTQCTILMKAEGVNAKHPDYSDLSILIALFGGYFGSRLMKNIREDKGLTYGILANMIYDSKTASINVQSSVDSERYKLVIDEIHKEMQRLIDEPIDADELAQVKSYCRGAIASVYSDIFNTARNLGGFIIDGLSEKFVDCQWNSIDNITPERLQQLAEQYLRPERFHIAVAGNV
ncbi:MAG: insulinase family protein [Bacteroidales bacterium]|nr:insulinase family protein [Bacteroidales bacterium]